MGTEPASARRDRGLAVAPRTGPAVNLRRRTARRTAGSTLAVAALLAAALGCASAAGGPPRPDAEIAADVEARLATAPEINPFTVAVDVRDGVVTLSGRVAGADDRARAEKLAREVPGVRRLVNLLEVGGA
jgi:osmotically-inducible protein OsmY